MGRSFRTLWRGAGGWLVLTSLAGLAAGVFREYIFPFSGTAPHGRDIIPAPLPTFETLAGSQAFFYLLILPLVMVYRGQKREKATVGGMVLESLGFLLASVPFFVVAGWLGDAVWTDGLRMFLAVLPLIPLGYAAGALMTRPAFRSPVLLLLLLLATAGPVLIYLSTFLTQHHWMRVVGLAFPLCFLWNNAAGPVNLLWPTPLWNWGALWGVSLLLTLLCGIIKPSPGRI